MTGISTLPGPKLAGLVVAGGASVRMGRDKGLIEFAGRLAVDRAVALLARFCSEVFVSVRQPQRTEPAYARYPLIVDRHDDVGPMASLLAAFDQDPACAWLALAVDMPLVDDGLLAELVAARDTGRIATAFRNEAGIPEPLCTIWEPLAVAVLGGRDLARRHSLRAVLEDGDAKLLHTARAAKLASANTPAELAALARVVN